MRETQETQIEGYDVRCTQHRARAAARLLAKVGRAIAPALSRVGKIESVKDAELADLGPALAALFEALSDDQVDALILEILSQTTITMPSDDTQGELRLFDLSKGANIDNAFTGRLPLMFACLKYALEVNFGSFFGGKGVLAAIAAAGAKAPSST